MTNYLKWHDMQHPNLIFRKKCKDIRHMSLAGDIRKMKSALLIALVPHLTYVVGSILSGEGGHREAAFKLFHQQHEIDDADNLPR